MRRSVIAATILGLFGALFAAVGLWMLIESIQFSGSAQRSIGTVIHVEEQISYTGSGTSRSRSITYQPTFRLQTWDGPVEAETLQSFSSDNFAIGEEVDILYDPDDPTDVRVRGVFSQYIFPLMFALMGTIAMVAAGLILRYVKDR